MLFLVPRWNCLSGRSLLVTTRYPSLWIVVVFSLAIPVLLSDKTCVFWCRTMSDKTSWMIDVYISLSPLISCAFLLIDFMVWAFSYFCVFCVYFLACFPSAAPVLWFLGQEPTGWVVVVPTFFLYFLYYFLLFARGYFLTGGVSQQTPHGSGPRAWRSPSHGGFSTPKTPFT